jgi:hypothetical protein
MTLRMVTKTVLPLLALALAVGSGCGAGGGQPKGGLTPDVAAGLATRAEQVATAFEAGQCDQALAGARSLQNDIAALPVDPELRAEALAGAARVVSGISCPAVAPPPVTAVTVPQAATTAPTGKPPKGKEHKGNDHDD